MLNYHLSFPGAWVEVTGSDASEFLQSQFSNDLASKGADTVYGLWLDRKGRVQADSFVLRISSDHYYLLSYFCSGEDLCAMLDKHIIADDVELNNVTNDGILISFWGESSDQFIEYNETSKPEKGCYSSVKSGYLFHGRRNNESNYEMILSIHDRKDVLRLLDNFDARCPLNFLSSREMSHARVEANIPAVPADIGAESLPHEGGLERDAVSLKKGCYLGQEVMARLDVTGRVVRGLYPVFGSSELERGVVELFGAEGARVGELKSVVPTESGWIGLALIKNKVIELEKAFALRAYGEPCVFLRD